MATIKSYTDIPQSKKLAEILSLKSADMSWVSNGLGKPFARTIPIKGDPEEICGCWSLAALLDVLPKNLKIGRPSLESNYKGYYWIQYYDEFMQPNDYITECFDNPVDACYEMIERVKEMGLI